MQMDRRRGFPRGDIERAALHFSISEAEAERKLNSGEIILPARGDGLETGRAAGTSSSGAGRMAVGALIGAALGALVGALVGSNE